MNNHIPTRQFTPDQIQNIQMHAAQRTRRSVLPMFKRREVARILHKEMGYSYDEACQLLRNHVDNTDIRRAYAIAGIK